MAVLNPILSLIDKGKRPDRVYLLPTLATMPRAEMVKRFLVEKLGLTHYFWLEKPC